MSTISEGKTHTHGQVISVLSLPLLQSEGKWKTFQKWPIEIKLSIVPCINLENGLNPIVSFSNLSSAIIWLSVVLKRSVDYSYYYTLFF